MPDLTPELLHDLAVAAKVCVRPIVLRCTDTETGLDTTVPIRCGSTVERTCPSCADRARRLRMQQCREGWHREDEPTSPDGSAEDDVPELHDDQAGLDDGDDKDVDTPARRVRSTRRRQDVADLPRIPMEQRTIGKAFTAPDGRVFRPSMFLTFTLPSYGPVRPDGTPVDPDSYDYRAPRSTRCTSLGWSTGSGRTCAAAPATRPSTSRPSRPNDASPHTCTPPSAE